MPQQEESIGGLAKRWLKTQLRFHGDPIKSHRDREEAEAIEQRIEQKAHDDATSAVVNALMPDSWKRKLESLERANEEGRIAREQQRRAEHEARQRVPLTLSLTGSVTGSVSTTVPILIEVPDEPGDPLTVDLEPLEPLEVGGHQFLGLLFAVPAYCGPGTYDLTAIEARLRDDTWDPLWFQLTIDTTDDGLYWSPDYGHATITVTDTSIHLTMPMSNSNGIDVNVDALVELQSGSNQSR
ncbi:MAG TPA: hypothetical protein VFV93_01505 [Thermomicrobiales bacterium]|nr:hypothetical protein [Thermomicrobiales bacterium]